MPKTANIIEASELFLYATNCGELYRSRTQPVMRNLARRLLAETYDAGKARVAWRHVADDAAKRYRAEFNMVGGFDPATRDGAAALIADYYHDDVAELAEVLRRDKANKTTWTLSAIKAANDAAGRYFFSRDTMRHFGDTMASFRVECAEGHIFVVRVRPMRDRDGRNMGGVGTRFAFDPATGEIDLPRRA